VALAHLAHSSASVRHTAAGILAAALPSLPAAREAVVKALATEVDPHVLALLIVAVRPIAATDSNVAAARRKHVDHPHPVVRRAALDQVAEGWRRGAPGAVELALAKLEADPDVGVRQVACRHAGRLGDGRLLPALRRLSGQAAARPALAASCLTALVELWRDSDTETRVRREAFRLTARLLGQEPRGPEFPPWAAMASLHRPPPPPAPWYDRAALVPALVAVAGDPRADFRARTGAAEALGKLGAVAEGKRLLARLEPVANAPDHRTRDPNVWYVVHALRAATGSPRVKVQRTATR
jgi:hypothetical protein